MSVHNFLEDALLNSTVACPAAAGTTVAPAAGGLDLGLNRKTWRMEFAVSVPAIAALADTKNLKFVIQDSDDNSSFAAIPSLGAQGVVGAGGVGCAAKVMYWPVPRDCRRYVNVLATADAASGTITGSNYSFKVLAL